jgi:di/tricarboxylate transporter/CRP-like cAMP-binding protein
MQPDDAGLARGGWARTAAGSSDRDPARHIPPGARAGIARAAEELASLPPFSELTPVDRARLAAALEEVSYRPGEVIFAEDQPGDALYILRQGSADRYAHGVRLDTVHPPAVFGDLALLRDQWRATTLVAANPVVVWRLPAARFTRVLQRTPGIGARFAAVVSDRLAAKQQELAGLALEVEDLAERLYGSLEPAEQEVLERAAVLPVLDPAILGPLLEKGHEVDPRRLPLADLLLGPDNGTAEHAATRQTYPPVFRRFLLARLESRRGADGVAQTRREAAALARAAGASNVALHILAEGGLTADPAEPALAGNGPERADEAQSAVGAQLTEVTLPASGASRQLTWRPNRTVVGLAVAGGILLLGGLASPPAGLSPEGWRALVVLLAAVPLLALDALPEGIVGLALAATWVLAGVADPRLALGGFATSGWALVVAVLLVGSAMASSGLLYRLALWSVTRARGGFVGQVLALMVAGVLLGPANPNATGRVVLVAPAVGDLVEALGYAPQTPGAVGLAMAALMGFGQMVSPFLTSSTTAVVVYAVLPASTQQQVSFIDWIVRAAPYNLLLLVGCAATIVWLYRPHGAVTPSTGAARRAEGVALQRALLGPMTRAEKVVLVLTVLLLIGFLTQPVHHIDPAWIAVLATIALAATGALTAAELRSINWSFALFYGMLASMADVLARHGVDKWLGGLVTGLVGGLAGTPVLFVAVLTLLCYAISFILRWQAAAPLLTIALVPAAVAAHIDPWIVGLVALVACNGFFLPFQSTTYLALYHGTNGRLFTHAQARPMAVVFGVVTLVALCASIPVWRAMGML